MRRNGRTPRARQAELAAQRLPDVAVAILEEEPPRSAQAQRVEWRSDSARTRVTTRTWRSLDKLALEGGFDKPALKCAGVDKDACVELATEAADLPFSRIILSRLDFPASADGLGGRVREMSRKGRDCCLGIRKEGSVEGGVRT